MENKKKVVVIGGGSGTSALLKGLKKYPIELTAIVTMSDNGGSTGILKQELDILPTGDIRQCVSALMSEKDAIHFNHRFSNGFLKGHSAGNISLAALTKSFGSFDAALEHAHSLFSLQGKIIPVTLEKHELKIILKSGKVLEDEAEVEQNSEICSIGCKEVYLEPQVRANEKACIQLQQADMIIIGPGSLYQSIIPVLLPEGIQQSFHASLAHKVYVSNLVNKNGHTTGFVLQNYLTEISQILGKDPFNSIILHKESPNITNQVVSNYNDPRIIVANLIGADKKILPHDLLKRNRFMHDSNRTAALLYSLLQSRTVVIFDLDDTLFDRTHQIRDEFKESDVQNITLFPGVKEILTNPSFTSILLTYGEFRYQTKKLEILGIQEFFEQKYICTTKDEKKEAFKKIRELYPYATLISVGDRIDNEILYGNKNGTITVRVKTGHYSHLIPKDTTEYPAFEIDDISKFQEVLDILNKHK